MAEMGVLRRCENPFWEHTTQNNAVLNSIKLLTGARACVCVIHVQPITYYVHCDSQQKQYLKFSGDAIRALNLTKITHYTFQLAS